MRISGVGLVSPMGIGVDEHWGFLDQPHLKPETATGAVPAFELEDYLPSRKPYLDRHSSLGLLAAALALGEAGFEGAVPFPSRAGLALSTLYGNHGSMKLFTERVQKKGVRLAPPMVFPHTYLNTTASLIAIEFALRGPHFSFCDGAPGTAQALWAARRSLTAADAEMMLVGGIDYTPEESPADVSSESAGFFLLTNQDSRSSLCRLAHLDVFASEVLEQGDTEGLSPLLAAPVEAVLSNSAGAGALDTAGFELPVLDLTHIWGDHGSAHLPLAVSVAALMLQFGQWPHAFGVPGTEHQTPKRLGVLDVAGAACTLAVLEA